MQQPVGIICDILKGVNQGTPAEFPSSPLAPDDWAQLYRISCLHNVVAIIYEALESLPEEQRPPKNIMIKWGVVAMQSVAKYEVRQKTASQIIDLWSRNGISTMLLKGIGLSLYYPQPSLRTFSDIDVYNFGRTLEADKIAMEQLGVSVSGDVHHHTTFVYNGVLVENHFDFINTVSHKSNAEYEKILKHQATMGCSVADIFGAQVLLPSPMFNALFLMRHMAAHFAAERISLRHLLDWSLFLKAESSKIDFSSLDKIYEQFNMILFANAINGICINYLGLNQSTVPTYSCNKELEDKIFDDIVNPRFNTRMPKRGCVKIISWKFERYWANRWKHKLIYNESWLRTFFKSLYAHALKPKTITH